MSILTAPSQAEAGATVRAEKASNKPLLKLSNADWRFTILFLVSLSMLGFGVYPFLLVVLAMFINRVAKNRYDLLLMLMILGSSPGFISSYVIPVNLLDPLLVLSVIAMFFYRKTPLVKPIFNLIVGYVAFLVAIALISDESLGIQVLVFRRYACVVAFVIPLWLFANRGFDIQYFFRKALAYFLVICVMYAIDGLILSGWVLIPADSGLSNFSDYPSLWNSPVLFPFTSTFPRKYPEALYVICLAAYPLGRYYRLQWWQWALIGASFFVVRTMTVVVAFAVTYIFSQGHVTKVMRYCVAAIILGWVAYMGDSAAGSPFRFASTIDQFMELGNSRDQEDFAEFGSGRMIQIIPKWEALVEQNCEWLGFGFIHPSKSTAARYQITNNLVHDIEKSDESVAIVENAQFNTIIHTGIIGLLVQTLVFVMIYIKLRRRKDSRFYLATLIFCTIAGVGEYASINSNEGGLWVATAIGAVLLVNRDNRAQKAFDERLSEGVAYGQVESK